MPLTTSRTYLLAVLLAILAFNLVDRLTLGLVLQNIKADLSLSDTQLGFLSGIAFALFYSVVGIPLARWADRGNRVTIIAVSTALWSAAVALCGVAGNFSQLLLIRIGVAVGEAGCIPPAYSLIGDYFARAERPRAVAIYMLGGPLSFVVGYFLAGWLNEFYGWRTTFVVLGLPGLMLAILAWLTLGEPRRARFRAVPAPIANEPYFNGKTTIAQPSVKEVCSRLLNNSSFCHLLVCYSVVSFFGYGLLQWQPAFFIRSYGLKTGELGTWFALIFGLGGVLGTYGGGAWASRHAPRNERTQLKAAAWAYGLVAALFAAVYLSPSPYLAFAFMGLGSLIGNSATGPLFSTIQTLVPEPMRATAISIVYLCANLIGMGLGPLAAGFLSDALRPVFGQESLRFALLALCPGYVWGGWHLWRASRTVADHLDAAEADCEPYDTGNAVVVSQAPRPS